MTDLLKQQLYVAMVRVFTNPDMSDLDLAKVADHVNNFLKTKDIEVDTEFFFDPKNQYHNSLFHEAIRAGDIYRLLLKEVLKIHIYDIQINDVDMEDLYNFLEDYFSISARKN